ncbi:hypothetical protein OIE68_38090 [Nocardia vinacea]|uniref:hypothetical protein n=1 Tax=Nocardia vinacea TaxID=96468 RepID=UPI002E0F8819|nr:hypothetical protein OIE68_38090 [Nocardia vinacea]
MTSRSTTRSTVATAIRAVAALTVIGSAVAVTALTVRDDDEVATVASCFVAWQGQIIEQAKGGPIEVASLAHPGTVVELGPER